MDTSERYYDPEILARLDRLEIRARMIVEGTISGLHRSPYHGRSVEFADHRPYAPGDDPRHIDWKVYGRSRRIVTKRYEDETNLRAHLLLDISESMQFQHETRLSKLEYASTLAASLAYLLHCQHDSVGITLFDTEVRQSVPSSTHRSVLYWIASAMATARKTGKTSVRVALSQAAEAIPRRSLVILISDLLAPRSDLAAVLEGFRSHGHDLAVFHVLEQSELEFPFEGVLLFRGLEESPEVAVDPRALRASYLASVTKYLQEVEAIASRVGADYHRTHTGEPLEAAVLSFASARARLRSRR